MNNITLQNILDALVEAKEHKDLLDELLSYDMFCPYRGFDNEKLKNSGLIYKLHRYTNFDDSE